MRQYIRCRQGRCVAFTLCLADRQSTLLVDKLAELKHAFRLARASHPFDLHAWVVMPEHTHLLITMADNANYSHFIGAFKSHFSRQIPNTEILSQSRAKKGERGIWQRRFWEHTIRHETDFNNHMHYIHYNPVKHGYVNRVVDWQYSTFHYWVQQGLYLPHWANDVDLPNFE